MWTLGFYEANSVTDPPTIDVKDSILGIEYVGASNVKPAGSFS
jgi:hypothetical protein